MRTAVKRLALGILLIAAASAILLVADRGRRDTGAHSVFRIAMVQHATTPVLEDGVTGTVAGLAERGYLDGERIKIDHFNAHGDMPTGIAIAKQVVSGEYDLVITTSTPSMQAVANNNREGKVRHVFTLVADPFVSGVGLDRANPLKHAPFMIGQGSFPPVEKSFQLARQMLPGLQRVGVAWNPAESNSLAFVAKAREVTKAMGLTLLEATVDNTSAVTEAVSSLVSRDAQLIWVGGDNTVNAAFDAVIATARRSSVPVVSVLPGAPDRGTLFDAGPNFVQVGRQGGILAADIIEGADISKIPVRDILDIVPSFLSVNVNALKGLKEPWRVPDGVLAEADVIVDAQGIHRKAAPAAAAPVGRTEAGKGLQKKWRVTLIHLNRILDAEEAEKGVRDGLREQGLVEGRDFEAITKDAQGDMATISSIVDAALVEKTDLIISFSTPALQATLQRAKQVPVVFNYVSDPIAAGAGTSNTQHAPNTTGVYFLGAYDEMPAIIRSLAPKAHVLGTIYVPAEVNMVSQLAVMQKAMRAAGYELKAVAANSPSEVGEAALALVASHIDAFSLIPGNLTAAAFPGIARAAQRGHVPMFVYQGSQVRAGALAGLSRDYYDSGRLAAEVAARVMRGESPASIPFAGFAKTKLLFNVGAARDLGVTIPADLLKRADEVVGR